MSAVPSVLQAEYKIRFSRIEEYRGRVWDVLCSQFFQQWVPAKASLLDLGAGWCEFVNHIHAGRKYAMDLNPETAERLQSGIQFLQQDCSHTWPLADASLDVVFTSNFFEHLLTKDSLAATVSEAFRCLRPGGRLICLGPNVRYLPGAYWDFWDHYLPLTELSLSELLRLQGYVVEKAVPRFLPYTMSNGWQPPLACLSMYLKMPWAWPLFGKQFLVIAQRPE